MRILRHSMTQHRLDAFADAELAEHQEMAVLRHLDECVDCVTELEWIVWTKTQLAWHSRAEFSGDAALTAAESAAIARLQTWTLTELLECS